MALTILNYDSCAMQIGVDPDLLRAIGQVETQGASYLPNGQLKIVFERHWFFKILKSKGIHPKDYLPDGKKYESRFGDTTDIINSKAYNKHKHEYGPADCSWSYRRLNQAAMINVDAAYQSTSFGKFQMMGFNYTLTNYGTAIAMKQAFDNSELAQLQVLADYLLSRVKKVYLVPDNNGNYNWAMIAKNYNGSGDIPYYSQHLKRAFNQIKSDEEKLLGSILQPVISSPLNAWNAPRQLSSKI